MKVLQDLKEKLNIDDCEYYELEDVIKNMEDMINSQGYFFDDQVRIGLYSHMVSFIRRLKKNEVVVDADDEEVVSQISKKNIESAKTLIEPLFNKYEVELSNSEIVLIAIYLEASNQK